VPWPGCSVRTTAAATTKPALCTELTATATRYPGTELALTYSIKDHP